MKIQLSVITAVLLFTNVAHAQFINGSVLANANLNFGQPGQFQQQNNTFFIRFGGGIEIQSGTGDFASLAGGTAGSGSSLSGNASGPNAEDVPNFFSFSSRPFVGTSSTSPQIFEFNLTLITETAEEGVMPQSGSFIGTGILVDESGVLQGTPASFDLEFSQLGPFTGIGSYTFFLASGTDAAPEPTSWALGLLGCGAMAFLRFRARDKT